MLKRLFALLITVCSLQTFAQGPVISAKDFAIELKNNKNLVVIDANTPEIYGKQHIQGAISVPLKELYKAGGIEGQVKSPQELAAYFGKKGISNTSKIVLYDEGSNRYNTRVWWILKSLGVADASLLHFNMSQFAAAKIPLSGTPASRKATTFTVAESKFKACTADDVKNRAKDSFLLDAREKDEYNGVDAAGRSEGHIPGAVWMNFKEVLTATGAYKTKQEIVAAAAKLGVSPDKRIIVYCNSGVKAAVLYTAMKEIAGFPNVQFYAGSYADWASNPKNPIVR